MLTNNLKDLNFLVYGLGLTGRSVVNFLKRNKIANFKVWDDKNKSLYRDKRPQDIYKAFKETNYIILSPGISFNNSKYKKELVKYRKKIITDIDLIFLTKKNFKSIVVTGTNGKSTTCKIIEHVLKKNKFNVILGGNIGVPILNLRIKKKDFLIIEASSYQLEYSKFVCPDFALLLNISNDHLDWHGNMNNYINSKLKVFSLQKKSQFSLLNNNLEKKFKNQNFLGKLIIPKIKNYRRLKKEIKNFYIKSEINDENVSFAFELSKLLKIKEKSFIKSLNTFVGLNHRYEVFMKKKNIIFINDSKATSFEPAKFALKNTQNAFWIAGGLPKKNDKFYLNKLKKNIIKCYLIGDHINFFKKQVKDKIKYTVSKNLRNAIIQIIKDVKSLKLAKSSIILSPAAASFDQFQNFEERGKEFKKLSNYYARKYF